MQARSQILKKPKMLNNFTLELHFSKPADLTGEIGDESILSFQSAILHNGCNKGQLFLTVNGNKLVIANLSARRPICNLNLQLSGQDGEIQLSCSQGSSIVVRGFIEDLNHDHEHHHEGGCCDHDHGHEHEDIETGVESEDDADSASEVSDEDELLEDDESADDDEEEDDEENEDEDEYEDEDDDDEEEDDEEDEDEEESEEEEEAAKPQQMNASKKVTFNPNEQGPHKHNQKTEQAPLKPAIKQAEKPASKVGTTVTLKGGLKYTIVKEGTGPVATNGRRVNVRYVGCLASNGKQFDKGTIRFRLGGGEVIQGWDLGVAGMRVREARRLLIPAHLGYGRRGAPPAIPPNAALAFEVELLDTQ